jgi:hypothetical protein
MTPTQNAERRPRAFHDLREYLSIVKEMGHLKLIEGADAELEIGALYRHDRRAARLSGAAFRCDQELSARRAGDDQPAQ